MKVMILIKASAESEAGVLPDAALLSAMTAYNEALAQAGVLLAGEGLQPTSKGARVRFSGAERTVIPGPFHESGLIAGFWLWQVDSMDAAVEWLQRCPNPMPGETEVEIRRLYEAEDFGDLLTPELREREDKLRQATRDA